MKTLLALAVAAAAVGCFATSSRMVPVQAPELVGHDWHNTARPIHLADLNGKVVLVHFWTLGCINCKHNLGAYNAWQKRFSGPNFQMIGIHTPETDFERSSRNLDESIREHKITYPVLVDNDSKNWNRWHQQFWPAIYLIDRHGKIRDSWSGELEFDHAGGTEKLTKEIEALLAEQ